MKEKDIKLLWGRAANRCSMPGCRKELSHDNKNIELSSYTLGEQAHIIGEKEGAPRGKSLLTESERNSYHNLILLCPTHHTEIDKNELNWPVEKLHYIKSTHELWVRETLGDSSDNKLLAKQLALTSIIDTTVELCQLENWKSWTSKALSPNPCWEDTSPHRLFEFRQKVAAAIWPEEYQELKRATTTLSILLHKASSQFMEHSRYENGFYVADRFYRDSDDNIRKLNQFNDWIKECYSLVEQSTCAANWFADVVRRDINPMFFVESGKFVIVDGPYEDLSYHARIVEYTETQKSQLPDILAD